MAIILTEGFDLYATKTGAEFGLASRWIIGGNTAGVLGAGHYSHGQCMRYSNPTGSAILDQLNLGANYAALGASFTMLVSNATGDWGTAGTGEPFCSLYDSANALQLEFMLDPAGNFHVRRGATVVASSSGGGLVTSNSVVQIEFEIVVSDTVGSIKLWVGGSEVINASALDTQNTGNTNVLYFAMSPSNTLDSILEFDNLILTDGSRPGVGRRVVTLKPTADTADKDFIPVSGVDNFAMVDGAVLSSTDYVQGTVVGDLDLYELENLPGGIAGVDAVSFLCFAAKTDAASRSVRAMLKSASTSVGSASLSLATTYTSVRKIEAVDPNGANPWTPAAVDALKAGVEVLT